MNESNNDRLRDALKTALRTALFSFPLLFTSNLLFAELNTANDCYKLDKNIIAAAGARSILDRKLCDISFFSPSKFLLLKFSL